MHRVSRGLLLLCVALTLAASHARSLQAAGNVVRAILFYSPSCGHCHYVITEVLPPLMERYGEQLEIVGINTINPTGQELYQAAVQHFDVSQERRGTPTLIIFISGPGFAHRDLDACCAAHPFADAHIIPRAQRRWGNRPQCG
jgi:thiol-disulfide isomerase/thioredoxin